MKKQFFIFFCFVFCGLFNASAFGDNVCSYDVIKNWKPGNQDISNCSDLTGIFSKPVPPIWAAMNDKDGFRSDTGYTGNPEAVEEILKVRPSAAKEMESVYPNRTALHWAIENCCVKGTSTYPNRTSDIVKIIIKYDPESKNEIYHNLEKTQFEPDTKVLYHNKSATMLDYVRYVMKFEDSCKKTKFFAQCKEIEKILIQESVPANEGTDAAKGYWSASESPAVTEPLKTDDEQVKSDEAEKVVPALGVGSLIQDNATEFNKPVSVSESAVNDVDKAQQDLKNKKLDFSEIKGDISSDVAQQNNTDEENTLEEKQKAYDEAKAKEQSTANKLLGGLSTAATGIGGMQLMQGLAEQSSDKDAAADMAAYIETMRCTYGDGKQVKAGPDEIELPGANDSELMKLRSEYLALAADLKERKEALGMKPGIESETILDRSATGLYDDENIGISGGNYGSLYRAQALKSETDQQKIDDAKNTSGNRVKYGATAAGAGVVVGVVGNSLINGKLGEKIKSAKEKKDVDKNEKQALEKLQKCLKNGGAKKTSDLKFEKFTPSVLHIEKISCSGSAWKEKVNNKDATKLFADTTDEATIKETLIKNFDFEIAGKLLEEDLQVQQNQTVQEQQQKPQSQQVEQEQKNQKQQEKQQQSEPEQKTQKDPEQQKQQVSKQEEKRPEQQKQAEDKPQQKQEEQNSEKKQDQKQQEDQQKQEKKQEQKPQKKQEQQQKAPEQKQEAKQLQQKTQQKNDKGNVSARKNTNANGTKTKVDIDTFKDVQVNLEQGKKIVELWAAKNNKKNFRFVSKNISTTGQDYLTYQDDTNVYTFEFDDLTELISGTRKEGIGTAICLIYKGKPSTGANFIQCNNVKCSDFMSAAKKIDSSVKEWHAPNLPYGQKTTIYTECRMST